MRPMLIKEENLCQQITSRSTKKNGSALKKKADELRRLTVQTTVWGGSGHIGGAMSAMDAMTILYHRFMKLDVNNPDLPDRDRFVLSKGHAKSRLRTRYLRLRFYGC